MVPRVFYMFLRERCVCRDDRYVFSFSKVVSPFEVDFAKSTWADELAVCAINRHLLYRLHGYYSYPVPLDDGRMIIHVVVPCA